MLPCICSVIDQRSGTRAVVERITDVFYHILTSSVIYYCRTNPLQHGIGLFYTMNRKDKKKKKKTTNLPRTTKCSRICVSLNIFVVTNGSFTLCSLFSSLLISLLCSSSQKSIRASTCSKQNTRENILKTASLS